MKIAPLLAVLSLASLLGACNSLDNPLHGLLNTGNDARVLNTSTGSYEWPNTTPEPKPKPKPADVPPVVKATPTPATIIPAQKASMAKADTPKPTPQKTKATPKAVAKARATPGPSRESGVLNLQTGKIDWTPSGVQTNGKPADLPVQETQATPAPSAPAAGPLFPQ
jgi:outer membrane biosynthesis protein TonB